MTDYCPHCHGDGIDPACDGHDEFDHCPCAACDGTGQPLAPQPMTPERLAEIHAHDQRDRQRRSVTPSMVADIADHRTELLAELDRLTASHARALELADETKHTLFQERNQALTQLAEARAEIDGRTPRRITDINEIEALPTGSILLEHIPVHPGHAMAWRKEIDGWWYPSTFSWVRQRGALAMAGAKPLLIHAPGTTAAGDTPC